MTLHHAQVQAARNIQHWEHHIGVNCHEGPHLSARSARAEANAAMPANERRQCVAITAPGCNHQAGVMAEAVQAMTEGLCRSID